METLNTFGFTQQLVKHRTELRFLSDEIEMIKRFLKANFPKYFADEAEVNRAQLLYNRLASLKLVHQNIVRNHTQHYKNMSNKSNALLELESARITDEVKDLTKNLDRLKREMYVFFDNSAVQEANLENTEFQLD